MGSSTTSAVYISVIEDVMNKVREEFVNNGGAGEGVLNELQGRWEMKLMQAGAILGPAERPSVPKLGPGPVHDLNVPYEGAEEYETPTAEMLFPPTPMQTPIQTPMPGTTDSSVYNIFTGPSDYPTPYSNEGANGPTEMKHMAGRPSPYMQPPSPWMNQRSPLGMDVNKAYAEGRELEDPNRGASLSATQEFLTGPSGKRKRDEFASQYQSQTGGYIPQQDGAGDVASDVFELEVIQSKISGRSGIVAFTNQMASPSTHKGSASRIAQLDGQIPDPYEDVLSTPNIYKYQQGVVNEDYNTVNTPVPNDMQVGTPAVPVLIEDPEYDDDEPPLNENDDDDLDDVEVDELNTQHLVLAQFDKVTRTKSRWKCTLKDGIMHINNKDILFSKATGEFDF